MRATFAGSSASSVNSFLCGEPFGTEQNPHPRAQRLPRIMKVSAPRCKHSCVLGQIAAARQRGRCHGGSGGGDSGRSVAGSVISSGGAGGGGLAGSRFTGCAFSAAGGLLGDFVSGAVVAGSWSVDDGCCVVGAGSVSLREADSTTICLPPCMLRASVA